ncbi:hypothetical protein HZS_2657 [Henneguya salminicola]|nr:hypothetical protein HZS_2657 [Henneguya salminicola]
MLIERSAIQKNLLVLKKFPLLLSKVDGLLLSFLFHEIVQFGYIIFKTHRSICICMTVIVQNTYLGENICKIMKHFFQDFIEQIARIYKDIFMI